MNWAWANLLDQFWRSATFPMWLTLAAAGFFALILLVTLLRAERSVANGALTVITLLAIGVAGAATIRSLGTGNAEAVAPSETAAFSPTNATLPALSCIDDLAGEAVLTACEKVLFGSPESVAAAVSYVASRVTRLTALGDVAIANRNITPDLQALRHAVERDRYGLVAHVLLTRDHCTPVECAAFRSLTDHGQIVANMDERVYDGLISRYAASWNVPVAPAPATVAALPSPMPTGRPTNADFPSAASTPAVSIMTPEPGSAPASRPASAAAAPPPPPHATASAPSAAKKPPRHMVAPVQLAPAPPTTLIPSPAPAASND
jgi:hypothetical protein